MRSTIDLWMTRLSYFYITLPFVLFSALWLNIYAAIVFSGIAIASFVFSIKLIDPKQFVRLHRNIAIWTILAVVIIVFFSGIGSYTFQNEDHLYRNAMFRDLVLHDWPVVYKVQGFEGHFLNGKTTIMTYYLGYYLPAAFFGKLFGFEAGKFFLYFWTVLGILIILYQIGKYLSSFSYKVVLIFFAWGSLFFIGSLIKYPLSKVGEEGYYLWAGMRLYADSNLGSLYWIFNQSLTAWTIIMLILNKICNKNIFFVYCLCLFLSPFCFVGLSPYIAYLVFVEYKKSPHIKTFIAKYISFQNIAGALAVLVLTYFYLQTNQAGKKFNYIPFSSFKVFAAFILLSWGILAVILFPKNFKNPLFWISILILIPLPFFQQGNGMDFPGRISMPANFILMLLAMKLVLKEKRSISLWAMIIYICITGIAHFSFQTGASMFKTGYANLSYRTNIDEVLVESDNAKIREIGKDLRSIKNKDILTKDYGTILNPENQVIWNYMADTEGSIFYNYLAKKREP